MTDGQRLFKVKSGPVLVAAIVFFGIATTSCSKASSTASNKAISKAIEHQTGGSVDVRDGGATFKGKDGETLSTGSSAKLPDGWPAALKLPAGFEIQTSASRGDGSGKTYYVGGSVPKGTVEGVETSLKKTLTSAGFKVDGEQQATGFASIQATKGKETVAVVVGEGSSSEVTVSITLTPG